MMKNDKSLEVVGVEHLATANNLTVRVRVYFRRFDGEVYSLDADETVWNLHKLGVKVEDGEISKIQGRAQ